MIRWRIVTHGAIDGYSRLITYLCASTNNEAKTVYELFLLAVQKHQLPSRVRSDQGTENVLVAQHMIEKRGAERHSMITGSSVHNQHIERLWRDMHKSITILSYKLFYFLEHHSLLDHLNERHLWALQYVFVPRINRCLQQFVNSWNNHPIRTAKLANFCPRFLPFRCGVDPDGPIPLTDQGVSVPRTSIIFLDTDIQQLRRRVHPCGISENYGINLYEETLEFISTLTPI